MSKQYNFKALFEEAYRKSSYIKLRIKDRPEYPVIGDNKMHYVLRKEFEEIKGNVIV